MLTRRIEIVEDSRGVFLWVVLVIDSLLLGLTNQDRLTELRNRLERTPKTLNAVFERMLDSVEDIYHEQAAQILLVALHTDSPLPVILYSYIGDDNHDAFNFPIERWDAKTCDRLSREAQVRIKVRCPDLIKIRHSTPRPETSQEMMDHVDFLHRTVRDFLSLEDTQRQLKQRLTKPFDPCLFLCHGLLTQLKGATASPHSAVFDGNFQPTRGIILHMFVHAKELEMRTGQPQLDLLDEAHRVLAHQFGYDGFLLAGDSFMSLAVVNFLNLYVDAKLPEALKTSPVSLLRRALLLKNGGTAASKLHGPSAASDMVHLLLEHGANPNEMVDATQTIWSQFITDMYQARETASETGDAGFRLELKEKLITIIQDMLQHGADPTITFQAMAGG
jgi:hypothetical protein